MNSKTVRFSLLATLLASWVFCADSFAQILKPLPTESAKESKPSKAKNTTDKKGQQKDAEDILNKFTKKYDRDATFLLKYKFRKGSVLRWNVEHTATTDTRSKKHTEKTASRSLSTMQWRITNIDSLGNFDVGLSVLDADMWQQTDQQKPITYNSLTHRGKVPDQFATFAEGIGVPIATYKISPSGRVIDKNETYKTIKFGVGSITMPVPKDRRLKIGDIWNAPSGISLTRPEGGIMFVKTRVQYRLLAVENGIAIVSFDTHVLTPVEDPKMKSQLIQQLSKGTIRFDIEKGLMISKKLSWSEKVLGFLGGDSSVDYNASYNIILDEKQLSVADLPEQGKNTKGLQKFIRLSEDQPIFRW